MSAQTGVLTRCGQTQKLFQIVFEEQSRGQWVALRVLVPRVEPKLGATGGKAAIGTHAAPALSGSFSTGPQYPGCPHCHNRNFWRCGTCTELNCYDGHSSHVTCAWCGLMGSITGSISALNGSGSGAGGLAQRTQHPAVPQATQRPAIPQATPKLPPSYPVPAPASQRPRLTTQALNGAFLGGVAARRPALAAHGYRLARTRRAGLPHDWLYVRGYRQGGTGGPRH